MSNRFESLAGAGLRGLKPYQPGKPISELEREYGVSDIVKLASNENPLGPSTLAVQAVEGGLDELARYPDGGCFALKTALAKRHGVDPQCITIGNGSNEVLVLLANAFLDSRREAVFSQYAFAAYPLATLSMSATPRMVAALPATADMPLGHDLDAMAAAINSNTRLVFIANPNNPTGTWLSAEQLDGFLTRVPEDVIVVVDEAYFEYAVDSVPGGYPNMLERLSTQPNLVVTRTFSKAYGLAGLRVGYCVSHPDIADLLNRVRQAFNVNENAQLAALATLDDADYLTRGLALNREGLQRLQDYCGQRGLKYCPSIGNFLLVEFGAGAADIYEALLREAVIVRPVAPYGLNEHLRISIGTAAEMDRLFQALDKVLG